LGWQLESLSRSDNGPWVYVIPDEATKRLADLPDASLSNAAAHVLDVEEADLPPQARSGPATRPSRVSWWRDDLVTAQHVLELARSAKNIWMVRSPEERRDLLAKLLCNPVLDGSI